ncbi:MAG: hypothetical protein U0835_09550 [Isosphaeraceae bacterium]
MTGRALQSVGRIGMGACVLVGICQVCLAPRWAPWSVLASLLSTTWVLRAAWKGARDTGLGSAVIWAGISLGLAAVSQASGILESVESGRPASGHWTYLSVLAALAGLISVLNARTPGGGAWAILTALLVLVFLIPWLEGPGLARRSVGLGRLRLDNPWTIFYGLLVLAGVTNYLPTRFGRASAVLGLGFVLEYAALSRFFSDPETLARIWSAVPLCFAAATLLAGRAAGTFEIGGSSLERLWFWFRDHWGAVWALRVMERFNRTAEAQRWPFRLTWHGCEPADSTAPDSGQAALQAAEETLRILIRRFAEPSRMDQASRDGR